MMYVAPSLGSFTLDRETGLGLIRDAYDQIVAMVPLRRYPGAEALQAADGSMLAAAPEMLCSIERVLELHAGGSLRLPDGMLREMLLVQQAARGRA